MLLLFRIVPSTDCKVEHTMVTASLAIDLLACVEHHAMTSVAPVELPNKNRSIYILAYLFRKLTRRGLQTPVCSPRSRRLLHRSVSPSHFRQLAQATFLVTLLKIRKQRLARGYVSKSIRGNRNYSYKVFMTGDGGTCVTLCA